MPSLSIKKPEKMGVATCAAIDAVFPFSGDFQACAVMHVRRNADGNFPRLRQAAFAATFRAIFLIDPAAAVAFLADLREAEKAVRLPDPAFAEADRAEHRIGARLDARAAAARALL